MMRTSLFANGDATASRSARREERLAAARKNFLTRYGPGEVHVLRIPARINILGEHVDYVSYLPTASLPFGSREHEMLMLYRPSGDRSIRGASAHVGFAPFSFDLEPSPVAEDWIHFVFDRPAPAPHWSNYCRGAALFAQWKYGKGIGQGIEFLLDSTIPPAGGSSSSSAIVVLAGAAIRLANGISLDPAALARESAQAEWFLGTRGGALDHTAICLSREGQILLMDHARQTTEWIPFPADSYRWVTFFSHVADKGRAVMLEYNERAAVSRLVIPALLARLPSQSSMEERIESLPERLSLADFAQLSPQTMAECRSVFPALLEDRWTRPLAIRDRARHHLGESQRVAQAVARLRSLGESGTPDLVDSVISVLGGLLEATHESLRTLYQVSNSEVEALVEVIGGGTESLGCRLMGGGFGGNVLVLCRAADVDALVERVEQGYYAPRQRSAEREGAVMISTPGDGISRL
jgi:galactokinase